MVIVGGGTEGGFGGSSSICVEGTKPPPSLAILTESEADLRIWDVVCGNGDISVSSGLIVWRTLSSWFATARAYPTFPNIGDVFWVYNSKAGSVNPARTLVTSNRKAIVELVATHTPYRICHEKSPTRHT